MTIGKERGSLHLGPSNPLSKCRGTRSYSYEERRIKQSAGECLNPICALPVGPLPAHSRCILSIQGRRIRWPAPHSFRRHRRDPCFDEFGSGP